MINNIISHWIFTSLMNFHTSIDMSSVSTVFFVFDLFNFMTLLTSFALVRRWKLQYFSLWPSFSHKFTPLECVSLTRSEKYSIYLDKYSIYLFMISSSYGNTFSSLFLIHLTWLKFVVLPSCLSYSIYMYIYLSFFPFFKV